MQHIKNGQSWVDWLDFNAGDPDKIATDGLAALRECIYAEACNLVGQGEFGADWANKKLFKLGISQRVLSYNSYEIEAPITGMLRLRVSGNTRADALASFLHEAERFQERGCLVASPEMTSDPVFTSGPEDDVAVQVDPDAPTTVDATLTMLREIILLGHIAGPKYCVYGANEALASFGLAPVPERKEFTVTRPVGAVMTTKVAAYDEDSAVKVAEWRWDDGQRGWKATNATPTGNAAVQVDAD